MQTTQATTLSPLQEIAIDNLTEYWSDLMIDCDTNELMNSIYQLYLCASSSPDFERLFTDESKISDVVRKIYDVHRSLDAIRYLVKLD